MKIALIGYGKMGKAIEEVATRKGHVVVLKISKSASGENDFEKLTGADVAIEFTQPQAAFTNVLRCFDANVPVVCGTTGWNGKLHEAEKICKEKKQAFFHAPNFSIGVNLFFELNARMTEMSARFNQYNRISITEIHHTQKKDAPSGTAIALANAIIRMNPHIKKWESDLSGHAPAAGSSQGVLPISSVRTGDVPGTHEVRYESEDDTIMLVHEAKGRSGFANGAVMAAEWLVGKKGVFGMKDLLQL